MKRLSPRKSSSPGEDVHQRVVGALLGDVVELGAGRRPELAPAAVQLVKRRASQDVVELGHRLLVTRVVGVQLLDPAPRRGVARRRSPVGRIRRRFEAHDRIVDLGAGKTDARRATNRPKTVPLPRSLERTMGLSWQQGPLGRNPNGQFLVPDMSARVLYAEPLRRRMRVELGGQTVVQSETPCSCSSPGAIPSRTSRSRTLPTACSRRPSAGPSTQSSARPPGWRSTAAPATPPRRLAACRASGARGDARRQGRAGVAGDGRVL